MQKHAAIEKNTGETGAKSAETREKIFRTAEALFIERGYDGVSIKHVAENAGVTKGHIYYYFKNKQALFDMVLRFDQVRDSAALAAAMARAATPMSSAA